MNRKLIIGVSLAVLLIAGNVVWDLKVVPNIESVEVVVVKPGVTIHKNDIIKAEDLITEKRHQTTIVEGYLTATDINSITGKQAIQTMVGKEIVSVRYLDMDGFVPNPEKGEAIRPIPNQWIYALPATVRRKDKIDVYIVPGESSEKLVQGTSTNQNIEFVGLSPEQEIANEEEKLEQENLDKSFENDRQELASGNLRTTPVLLGEQQEVLDYEAQKEEWLNTKGLTQDQWLSLVSTGDIPLLVDVPVAYAKDGAGNEIQNNGEQQDETRLSATGTIVNLELLLNEENHRSLMNYVNKGYQLYITYN